MDEANSGTFILQQSAIELTQFTVIELANAVDYTFKVQARNDFGFGDFSSEIVIACAAWPEQPFEVTTTNLND
jgi:hypothetical protein